jgi:pyruvate/2-oxoglutarate dehydrogenase complex dihydrolipoamide acyltransferase (E2) component
MKVQLKLARVGMNMEEATIVRWHKKPGDDFAAGEVLYDIETEKVTMGVEAPGSGRLVEIRADEGRTVSVGETVCVVEAQAPSATP